jgi:type IX secretion system PorP/SprF family membrane protein
MGVMGGIVQSAFDAPANLTQNNDPAIPNTNTSTLRPDVGAGLMFHTHNWYVGVSSIHLVEFDYEYTNASKASMARHYFFTAGMDIPTSKLNKNFIISPSVFVRYTANADVQFDLNTNFMFLQRFWIGALYRHEDAVGILAGFLPTESFRIGYSYDISISNISGYNNGSHVIMLSYQFGKIKSGIVSPRFF